MVPSVCVNGKISPPKLLHVPESYDNNFIVVRGVQKECILITTIDSDLQRVTKKGLESLVFLAGLVDIHMLHSRRRTRKRDTRIAQPCCRATYPSSRLHPFNRCNNQTVVQTYLRILTLSLPIIAPNMAPLEEMHTAMVNRSIRTIKAVRATTQPDRRSYN
jgi:hypothetical protein